MKNILCVGLLCVLICVAAAADVCAASGSPDEIDRYIALKKKYDDLKFGKNPSDFGSPRYKELNASREKDEQLLSSLLGSYFSSHAAIKGVNLSRASMTEAIMAGDIESYCIDALKGFLTNIRSDDISFVVTEDRLVSEWLKRNKEPVTMSLRDLSKKHALELTCGDAALYFFSEITLPASKRFDEVLGAVFGTSQDMPPDQPSTMIILARKKPIIYVFFFDFNEKYKGQWKKKDFQKELKNRAASILNMAGK